MKMKSELYTNKKYEILDNILIKYKNNNVEKQKTLSLSKGIFSVASIFTKQKLDSIALYQPEYISQMYDAKTIFKENNLEYFNVIITDDQLKYPLNIKCQYFELFDNGISINTNRVKIYNSKFFNQPIGLLFELH